MSTSEADLELEVPRIGLYSEFTKRVLDILMSGFGLIALLPLFLLVAIAIKVDDPRGKVFYYQTRVGKHGKLFKMYKFRSMVHNADQMLNHILHLNEIDGAMFKIKDDPRITKVGRFIRKTSLDELPQFVNVLRGDMSMVGPRPSLPREVETYSSYERQRLQVIPGCTGLWQVSGRNTVDFKAMVELDLKYINQRSIWFDMKLIFRTISVLFRTKDAY
jgi:exopolysaccharide biosynthesis polyprenyl glycosylphosphotransferase